MRTFIRSILNRFGYDIVKTGIPYFPKTKNDVQIKVWNYLLTFPGNNVQHINYRIYPKLNAELGRLAEITCEKYTNASIIDVGANVGDTIAVIKSFVDAPILGIEGDPITFKYLKQNTAQFSNVEVHNIFLSDQKANLSVSLDKAGWNTTITPDNEGGDKIKLIALDDLIYNIEWKISEVKLLKTDVEGFDTLVLRGAKELIKEQHPVIFLEYNGILMQKIKEDGLSTILSLTENGYDKIIFFDHKGCLLLSTSLRNTAEIESLHHYISSDRNLLGYFDMAIFHKNDADIAEAYSKSEQRFL